MRKLISLPVMILFLITLALVGVMPAFANTNTTGGTGSSTQQGNGYVYGFPITVSAGGMLQSIGVNWAATPTGHVMVALYTAGSGKPGSLVAQSSSTTVASSSGWQDVAVPSTTITAGSYWVAAQIDQIDSVFYIVSSVSYYSKAYGSFDSTWSGGSTQISSEQWNMRVTYSTGPPANDFSVTASPSSQSIGAGGSATSTIMITAGSGFTSDVSLSVTSGCPSGVTCTVSPSTISSPYSTTATLTVPTLITTSGTFPVVVTATGNSITHTTPFTVTVTSSPSFNFIVKSTSTQVVVTVLWTGTGTTSVTIAGPGGNPTMLESGAVVYDRTSYVSGTSPPTNIHRVTFALSSPPAGTWTAYVSQSGATVTIEVT